MFLHIFEEHTQDCVELEAFFTKSHQFKCVDNVSLSLVDNYAKFSHSSASSVPEFYWRFALSKDLIFERE